MRLVLNKPGIFVGTRRGMIVVKEGGRKIAEVAPPQISRIVVTTRGATFSSALLRLIARHKIPLIVLSGTGFPAVKLSSVRGGAVKLKKRQYEAQSSWKALYLAKRMAWGKVVNQKTLLYHAAKSRRRSQPEVAETLLAMAREISAVADRLRSLEANFADKGRAEIMRLEAEAAEVYWRGFRLLLPEGVEFTGRRKRFDKPKDPVNVMLNYCYGLLASEVLLAVEYAGLEPFIGFLHKDSSRRPALVMDLMEEFRQPVVDRVILRLLRSVDPGRLVEDERLTRKGRFELVKAFYGRLDERFTFRNRCLPVGDHILLQARRLAMFLLDKAPSYDPFVGR